ncbi:MAG: SDR family oxidoreductase [Dehalococcoidia bacterium]|nr:SDR family oxidoreductase [Dehalococcoidia bacterium]MDD5493341.1 SDR family oxidoreductase [Dehalococcoidia bacterium]
MKITNFEGRTAYITGGSSGIGLAIAKQLASRGAGVIIFSRQADLLKSAIREIENCRVSEGQRFSYMQVDVSQYEMTEKVLSNAVSEFGSPDILINSAGIAYPQKFEDTPYEKFDDILKVNLYGTWNTIHCLLPYLKQKKGYIVNTSSIAGFIGVFGMTSYSASKFAIIGFSEALRSELKSYGVTVSVLCPPDVDTPMLEKSNMIKPAEAKALSSTADIMTPEAVASFLVKAMSREDFLLIPNVSGKFTHLLKRLLPGLTERIIDSKIKSVQKNLKTANKKI